MLMRIFFFCGESTTDMPLSFIQIQNFSDLMCQIRIDVVQAFCYILMYRALADSIVFGGLPYSRIVFNDISCNFYRTLFNI